MVYTDKVHIIADSEAELHRFAQAIGLHRCWFDVNTSHPHYDFPKHHSRGVPRFMLIQKAIAYGARVYPNKFAMYRAREANKKLTP